jgi:hypothetical protein
MHPWQSLHLPRSITGNRFIYILVYLLGLLEKGPAVLGQTKRQDKTLNLNIILAINRLPLILIILINMLIIDKLPKHTMILLLK